MVDRARDEPQDASGPVDLNGARLRLLFLVPFTPRLDGRHGGARVTAQLIANLADRHAVALVHLARRGEAPVDAELARACERVERVEQTRRVGRVGPKIALLRGVPTWASEVTDAGLVARVRELARTWEPDVVQLEFPVAGRYLRALRDCPAPRVMADHEASVRDLRAWGGPLAPITRMLDDRAWRRFERRVIEQVQAVVVFTARDRRALEPIAAGTPIVELPFGVAVPAQPAGAAGTPPPSILFVGNFMHPANTDAALWLGRSLLPIVRSERPDARLTIVGPGPPPEVRALAGDGIDVTGEVADVTPYLRQAAVVAAPIRVGGGMRVKVLEALAAGKAVVATPLAVEGLDVTAGRQLAVAEREADFARAVSRLLADEEERVALGGRARDWACEHLGWGASIDRYEQLYRALVAGGRPS